MFVTSDAGWLQTEPSVGLEARPFGTDGTRVAPCGVWNGEFQDRGGGNWALACRRLELSPAARERLVEVRFLEALEVSADHVTEAEGSFLVLSDILTKERFDPEDWRKMYAHRVVVWPGVAQQAGTTFAVDLKHPPVQILTTTQPGRIAIVPAPPLR